VVDRRLLIIAAVAMGGLALAGLAVPGLVGGALLLVVALVLAALTTVVHTQARTGARRPFDSRNWALRTLVITAVAVVGLVKIFH
jgi:hypothetical protein